MTDEELRAYNRARIARWRLKNPEKLKASNQKTRKKYAERIRAYNREYCRLHPDRVRAARERCKAHWPEDAWRAYNRERVRQWRKDNPEKFKAQPHRLRRNSSEHAKEYQRAWYAKNRGKRILDDQCRRMFGTVDVTPELRKIAELFRTLKEERRRAYGSTKHPKYPSGPLGRNSEDQGRDNDRRQL
jgi:hypothetical protein